MASEAGKGDKQRPTNKEAYDEAYDSDSEMLRDIRYDVKYIPEDHYEE